ncbi:MAG: hypothetical protein WDO17_07405 [Alphaproteobacteria bacterium]
MYVVIKSIKGRRYRYLQHSWREGKRVRTKSICLGPADGESASAAAPTTRKRDVLSCLAAQRLSPEDRALATAERHAARIDKYQRDHFGETAAERADREHIEHLGKLYSAYGLTVSDPKIAEAAKAAAAQSAPAAEAKESPSGEEGQGSEAYGPDDAQNN